eukprot:8117944-Pyramimonas_sp.AAC.1
MAPLSELWSDTSSRRLLSWMGGRGVLATSPAPCATLKEAGKGRPARGETALDAMHRTHPALDNPIKATGWTLNVGNTCSGRTMLSILLSVLLSLDYDRLRAST